MRGPTITFKFIMDRIDNNKILRHLNWLRLRCCNIYNDKTASQLLTQLMSSFTKKKIDTKTIDTICEKLYYGFNIDKDKSSMFDIGYTTEERINIRKNVFDIISEYNALT